MELIPISDIFIPGTDQNHGIILVDFSWILYKNFHAYRDRFSVVIDGVKILTGSIYGILREVASLSNLLRGSPIILCLDSRQAVRDRAEISDDYKDGRTGDPLVWNHFEEILESASLLPHVFISADYGAEADDVIYSLSYRFSNSDIPIYIYAYDRDIYQAIISPKTKIFNSYSSKGMEAYGVEITEKDFAGIHPSKLAFFRSISGGDSGDNISPGVRGIPKTVAFEFVSSYDDPISLLSALQNKTCDCVSQPHLDKWGTAILDNADKIVSNYSIMKLEPIKNLQIFKGIGSWSHIDKLSIRSAIKSFSPIIEYYHSF